MTKHYDKYDKIVQQVMDGFSTIKIGSAFDIEKLIIDRAAERELADDLEKLTTRVDDSLRSFARDVLYHKLEFTHIREQGLKIWGKKDNLAFSQFTISQILHEVAAICNPEQLKIALTNAGSKSAFQFFVDFLPHLRVDHELHLPEDAFAFLQLLGSFDVRSAWWEEIPRHQQDDHFDTLILKRPFTNFPWSETDSHTFHDFLSGYVQTLFNCCTDFLRIYSLIQGKTYVGRFAVACTYEQMVSPDILHLHLFMTRKYISEFENIDRIIYAGYTGFHTGGSQSIIDLAERPEYYSDLISSMKEVFGNSINYEKNLFSELARRRLINQVCHEDKPNNLLVDILVNYYKEKAKTLLSVDSEIQKVMENVSNGVD